jgi:hypothetical protein
MGVDLVEDEGARTRPEVGLLRPERQSRNVDLPAPEGLRRATVESRLGRKVRNIDVPHHCSTSIQIRFSTSMQERREANKPASIWPASIEPEMPWRMAFPLPRVRPTPFHVSLLATGMELNYKEVSRSARCRNHQRKWRIHFDVDVLHLFPVISDERDSLCVQSQRGQGSSVGFFAFMRFVLWLLPFRIHQR